MMPVQVDASPYTSLQAPLGALALAVALFGATLLWVRFGEAVYIERIFGAIAGCF